MAVPTSGILTLVKLAREAKYADYNGTQSMGTVAIYDIVNGGNAHGSTLSYPALNRNCLPNPTGSLPNDAANPCSQGLDVCFIIDYTGSMGSVIETVKSGLSSVISHISTESSSNYRLSMITVDVTGGEGGTTPYYASCTQYTSLPTAQKYNNEGSSGLYQVITAWEMFPTFSTNNGTSFTTAVSNLNGGVSGSSCIQLGSGNGTPEPMDLGLGLVINSTNFVNDFRSTAAKYIIMITDAPPGGPDDAFTADDYNQVYVPYKFSAWYGYDQDCTTGLQTFNSSQIKANTTSACSATINQTYYHNGSASAPAVGDDCYINQNQTTALVQGYYLTSSGGGIYITGTAGTVNSIFTCTPTYTAFDSSTKYRDACGETLDQIYYHDGSGFQPQIGDTCYTSSAGTTTLNVGQRAESSFGTYDVNSSGVVTSKSLCP